MKGKLKKTVFLLMGTSVIAGLVLAHAGCALEEEGVSVPGEIIGVWSVTEANYYNKFTIDKNHIYYFGQSTQYAGYASSYDSEIVEVDTANKIFKTKSAMYFAWHVSGNTLYLKKTNPGAAKPVLSGDWWTTSASYILRKE
jgi:hypothetical protein